MRVFILGGTGSIGTGLVRELIARSHIVTALSRSDISDDKLATLGAQPLRGDLTRPDKWVREAVTFDAVIHVASTFDDDMGQIDDALISALIRESANANKQLRLLYTGGCWLYGETGDVVATEATMFDPLPAFNWMVEGGNLMLTSPHLSAAIIHPAMVYHEQGGVFEDFLTAAKENRPIEVWGGLETRWPIVERSDLANAYCDILERPDITGHFNVASEQGVYVRDIVQAIAQHYGSPVETIILGVEELVAHYGSWAKGPTIDQQMSSQKLQRTTGWKPKVTDYRSSDCFARDNHPAAVTD